MIPQFQHASYHADISPRLTISSGYRTASSTTRFITPAYAENIRVATSALIRPAHECQDTTATTCRRCKQLSYDALAANFWPPLAPPEADYRLSANAATAAQGMIIFRLTPFATSSRPPTLMCSVSMGIFDDYALRAPDIPRLTYASRYALRPSHPMI